MTLYDTIWQIFTSRPNAWLTARKVRIILRDEHKLTVPDSEFDRAFREVRDTYKTEDGITILHFMMGKYHAYSLTNTEKRKTAHNRLLNRIIRNCNKRIVA